MQKKNSSKANIMGYILGILGIISILFAIYVLITSDGSKAVGNCIVLMLSGVLWEGCAFMILRRADVEKKNVEQPKKINAFNYAKKKK